MKKYFYLLFCLLLLSPSLVLAQYLRDNMRFTGAENFYPVHDSIADFYNKFNLYPLTFNNIFGIPEIQVEFKNQTFPFYFDFGNNGNIVLTDAFKGSNFYTVIDSGSTFNPDGSVRDKIYKINISSFKIFDEEYKNVKSVLAYWRTFSSEPFNGLVGLNYLKNKSFTLNCKKKYLLVSPESIVKSFTPLNAEVIQMERYDYHPNGIHFKGILNNKKIIVYFDTGKSQTALNRKLFPESKIVSDKSGSFYKGTAELILGGLKITIVQPRVKNIRRSINDSLPIGIEAGIDLLKHFIISVDRTGKKNVLIIHKN